MRTGPTIGDEKAVDPRDGRRQFPARVRNGKMNVRIGEFRPERADRGHSQNQIADSFELDEKDPHRAIVIARS